MCKIVYSFLSKMLPVIVLASTLPLLIYPVHTHFSAHALVFAACMSVRVCIRNVLVPNTTVSWQGVARQMGEAVGVREEIELMARATHFTVVRVYTCLCILVRMMLYAPSPPRSLSHSHSRSLSLTLYHLLYSSVCVCVFWNFACLLNFQCFERHERTRTSCANYWQLFELV